MPGVRYLAYTRIYTLGTIRRTVLTSLLANSVSSTYLDLPCLYPAYTLAEDPRIIMGLDSSRENATKFVRCRSLRAVFTFKTKRTKELTPISNNGPGTVKLYRGNVPCGIKLRDNDPRTWNEKRTLLSILRSWENTITFLSQILLTSFFYQRFGEPLRKPWKIIVKTISSEIFSKSDASKISTKGEKMARNRRIVEDVEEYRSNM